MDTAEEKAIVVYSKFNGDISRAVQKTTALKDLNPQNRIVVDDGMYVASVANLELEPSGFLGLLRLEFYQEMSEATEKARPQFLSRLVLNKFFKKKVDNKPDIIYGEKEYQKVWCLLSSGSVTRHWIILGNDIQQEAIGKMKVRLIEKQNLLFSNLFMNELFFPIFNSLREIYLTLGEF